MDKRLTQFLVVAFSLSGASCADETPPNFAIDAKLTIVPKADGFEATWPAATDDKEVAGYLVRLDGGKPIRVREASYTATGLTDFSTHTLHVQATDASGNDSSPLEAEVTTMDSTPPHFATWARAVANLGVGQDDDVRIMWTHAADNDQVVDYVIRAGSKEIAVVPARKPKAPMATRLETKVENDIVTIVARDRAGLESPPFTVDLLGARKAQAENESMKTDPQAQAAALAMSAGRLVPVDSVHDPAFAEPAKEVPAGWGARRRKLFDRKQAREAREARDAGGGPATVEQD